MPYITDEQITEMAEAILSAQEVTPLSHARKCEIAMEHAADEWGISPRITAIMLAVKLANHGWAATILTVKKELAV